MRFTALLVAGDQQHDEDAPARSRQREPVGVADERDRVPGRGLLPGVLEAGQQREHAEDHRDHGLADELRLAAQAEVALLVDLDEVVEEADRAQPDVQEEQEQRRRGRCGAGDQLGQEVRRGRWPARSPGRPWSACRAWCGGWSGRPRGSAGRSRAAARTRIASRVPTG